jgi:putative spermidine/putrescine transport system ATP-binding protein
MSASALTLRSIVRRYPGSQRPAVDDVSLELRPGELLALVGASGSGKTTTLRIVAGYEPPDSGAVLLDGVDITTTPPERRGFGMVFQHYALFPHLTVEDNVAFGLEARGVKKAERRERARRALAGVGLDGKGSRAVQALSGGEQQRVALARALVIEPRVLLLDEPLSNLDPTLRVAMREELRAMLHRSHVTALFVTHDQEDAFAVADRVALLRHGRLLQIGTPETLYDRPASREVAEFIGRASLLPARREGADALVTIGSVTQRARADDAALHGGAGDALAVLRPESLALTAADASDAWLGKVIARRFAGGVNVCHVQLDDGPSVEITTLDRGVSENDRVGVRLHGTVALVPAAIDAPEASRERGLAAAAR